VSRSPLSDFGGSLPSDRTAGCGPLSDGMMVAADVAVVLFFALVASKSIEALVSGQARGARHHRGLCVKEMKLRCKARWRPHKQRHRNNRLGNA